MKRIQVVAAIIHHEGKIFANERGYGEFKGWWEFPGGKVEIGESLEQALLREIKEELDIEISVEKLIDTIEYDYSKFHLSMTCFLCRYISGNLILKEAQAGRWLEKEEIHGMHWLPADAAIIDKVAKEMSKIL